MSRLLMPLFLLAFLCAEASAENFDVYQFANADEQARFEQLTHELRCPKCQNQTIADSNAPIALDLRQRTYELVREGRSNAEIVSYLKERYGEFITYRPPFNMVTALLWTGPFLLLFAVIAVLLWLRRRGEKFQADAPNATARPDAAEVSAILKRFPAASDQEPRA